MSWELSSWTCRSQTTNIIPTMQIFALNQQKSSISIQCRLSIVPSVKQYSIQPSHQLVNIQSLTQPPSKQPLDELASIQPPNQLPISQPAKLPCKQPHCVPASNQSLTHPNWMPLQCTPSGLPFYKQWPSLCLGKRPSTWTCNSPFKRQTLSCLPSDQHPSSLPDSNQITTILSTTECATSCSVKTLPTLITVKQPHTAPSAIPPIHFKYRYCHKSYLHKTSLSKHTMKEHSDERQRGSIHCHLCSQR